jgi:hypothetical protein
MDKDYARRITKEIMSDETIVPLIIKPEVAWCLAQALRVAARHPAKNPWGKKADIALAKKLERPIKERHPLPDIFRMEDLEPIVRDQEPLQIDVIMQEAHLIVCAVQLVNRHPDQRPYVRDLTQTAAKTIGERIIEHHPDAWLLIGQGWIS